MADYEEWRQECRDGPRSSEELGDGACLYCSLEEHEKGVHGGPNGPIMCADSGQCSDAYENYLEEWKEEHPGWFVE